MRFSCPCFSVVLMSTATSHLKMREIRCSSSLSVLLRYLTTTTEQYPSGYENRLKRYRIWLSLSPYYSASLRCSNFTRKFRNCLATIRRSTKLKELRRNESPNIFRKYPPPPPPLVNTLPQLQHRRSFFIRDYLHSEAT